MKFLLKNTFLIIALSFLLFVSSCKINKNQSVYKVEKFGAIADGKTLNTASINNAIATCSKNGGGTILFSKGIYLSGSIHLMSNVTLKIEKQAKILGALNNINAYDLPEPNEFFKYQDFGHSHFQNALIWGENLENISIIGQGEINGGGITRKDSELGGGDKAISLKLCNNIDIKGITIKQGGHFAILANACKNLNIDSLLIDTSRDGIDLMACSNVSIKNSKIFSIRYDKDGKRAGGDDAIGIKSDFALGEIIPSSNILIENCFLSSGTNAIQFGSETVGPIRDVIVRNCEIEYAAKAGLGITCNDGSIIENVLFQNIKMSKTAIPVFIMITDRMRCPGNRPIGTIKNITFENIEAFDSYDYIKGRKFTSTIAGHPNQNIENVSFKDIKITYKGGGKASDKTNNVPYTKEYAPRKLGVRPSSGFFIRHANNIKFENILIDFESPDFRPAFSINHVDSIVFDNVNTTNLEYVQHDVIVNETQNLEIINSNLRKTNIN